MTNPQIGRIARLLRVEPSEVTGLEDVAEADLRVLHDQISKRMFGDAQRQFARVAALSRSIPGPVAGVLAEKFLPPVMAARVSEMLDPAKARDLIGRVSVDYLVEIALALDPVRSKPVVQQLPPKPIGKVARALFARHEYAAMAEFVGTVTTEALMAAFEVATPHDLLAVVPLLDWNDNLDVVVAALPHHKVTEIATSLTALELADLAMALDPSRMGPIVAAVPVKTVEGAVRRGRHRGDAARRSRGRLCRGPARRGPPPGVERPHRRRGRHAPRREAGRAVRRDRRRQGLGRRQGGVRAVEPGCAGAALRPS
jgi:hypothetical protein